MSEISDWFLHSSYHNRQGGSHNPEFVSVAPLFASVVPRSVSVGGRSCVYSCAGRCVALIVGRCT